MELTEFQKKVYDFVEKIPCGRVTSYKHLAEAIGCKSTQAVGQALKKNPFAPKVPCHRVIHTDLRIGGYKGRLDGKELYKKIALLRREGVRIRNNRLENKEKMYSFG